MKVLASIRSFRCGKRNGSHARLFSGRTLFLPIFALVFMHGLSVSAWAQANDLEPNDSPAAATPLDLSSGYAVATGALGVAGDVDYYSFTAAAGSKVWLLVDTGGGALGADSFVTLLTANGTTVIEEDDDDGIGNGCDGTEESSLASAIAGRTLPEGGTFFIRINEFGDDNILSPYRLVVVVSPGQAPAESEPNDNTGNANTIVALGQSTGLRAGVLNAPGDEDVFAVMVQGGRRSLSPLMGIRSAMASGRISPLI